MAGVGAGAGEFSEMSESGVLRLLSMEKRRLSLSTSILDH